MHTKNLVHFLNGYNPVWVNSTSTLILTNNSTQLIYYVKDSKEQQLLLRMIKTCFGIFQNSLESQLFKAVLDVLYWTPANPK